MKGNTMRHALTALALAIGLHAAPAAARNIVLTNDDGLTSNIVALHRALVADGHDVIVSVPCTNQSGMGAALYIARPLAPLAEACLNDAAKAGDPGAGPMTRNGLAGKDFHYVAGTPVMSLLYGLDVLAQERWGALPDLVLSGPNEGQNVGAIILSSGTVSAAQYAAVMGIPAIALSAGANSEDAGLANPQSAVVAKLSADLVRALDEASHGKDMLPHGLALNVNFPDEAEGADWRITRIGSYNAYKLGFAENMAEEASETMQEMARARGFDIPALPGLNFGMNPAKPDALESDNESVVYRSAIAVSPMRAGYDMAGQASDWLTWQLADLLTAQD